MKNKLLLFVICFILITIYSFINIKLINYHCDVENINNILYEDLKNDMELLLDEKDIKYNGYKTIGATIIERNIYYFFDELIINRGKNDGVEINNAVVNNEGLVGIISEVYDDYSKVMLVTNGDINISVKINESFALYNNGLISNAIDYHLIKENDIVYTSGLTNIPEGIYVGEVKELNKEKANGRIDLINLKNLKYVYIIIGEE